MNMRPPDENESKGPPRTWSITSFTSTGWCLGFCHFHWLAVLLNFIDLDYFHQPMIALYVTLSQVFKHETCVVLCFVFVQSPTFSHLPPPQTCQSFDGLTCVLSALPSSPWLLPFVWVALPNNAHSRVCIKGRIFVIVLLCCFLKFQFLGNKHATFHYFTSLW